MLEVLESRARGGEARPNKPSRAADGGLNRNTRARNSANTCLNLTPCFVSTSRPRCVRAGALARIRLLRPAERPTAGDEGAVPEVAQLTGFPEMMDGRVKTLHPKVHGGLLARRDLPEHVAALKAHGIEEIDLLVVNLYPFEATVSKPGCTLEDAIENIDIGGPAMVRSAAKNWKDVGVLTDASKTARCCRLQPGSCRTSTLRVVGGGFQPHQHYDGAISDFSRASGDGPRPVRRQANGVRQGPDLRYGENPHQQRRSTVTCSGPGFTRDQGAAGKELSYNNTPTRCRRECVKGFDTRPA